MSRSKPDHPEAYLDTPTERFKQINASNALEGYEPSPSLLSIQKSIIAGELSIADAIKELRASYGLPFLKE